MSVKKKHIPSKKDNDAPAVSTPKYKASKSQQVTDAVATSNVETIAGSTSFAVATLFQHQSNTAHRLDMLAEAHTSKVLEEFSTVLGPESVSLVKLFRGEADSSIGSTLAQLSASQMAVKTAQSTPGDLSLEIMKLGSSVASLEAMIGGLVAILQVTLK